jgi:hypothetical protein
MIVIMPLRLGTVAHHGRDSARSRNRRTQQGRLYHDLGSLSQHVTMVCLGALWCTHTVAADIIRADRKIDWSQVGVPGGIPNRTKIHKTLTNIDNTGGTDVTRAIQSALNACPRDQVVVLPPGTFRIDGTTAVPNHRVLRGSGADRTVLTTSANWPAAIQFYEYSAWAPALALSGGASKGDTTIHLSRVPANLKAGMKVQITMANPAYVGDGIEGGNFTNCVGQWANVESVNNAARTISVSPPLYADYPAGQSPFLRYPTISGNRNFVEYAGLENLKIVNTNPHSGALIQFGFAAYCWVKDVETQNGGVSHVWSLDSYRCEIRGSYFHDVLPPLTSSRCYGMQLGTPNGAAPTAKTTAMLVEDNIWKGMRGSIFIGYGAAGCVFGYNYFADSVFENPALLAADFSVHSSYPMFNLIEGNVGFEFLADNFHGPAGSHTLFRNWLKGKRPGTTSALRSIELDRLNRNYNVVGNILGYSGIVEDMAALTNPAGQAVYQRLAPAAILSYTNSYITWMLGYVSNGGFTSHADHQGRTIGHDPDVAATLLRHGNYDYVNSAVSWDPSVADRSLPDSLYLNSQPSWWGGLDWPPIGPDRTPMTGQIPAGYRFVNATPTPVPSATSDSPEPVQEKKKFRTGTKAKKKTDKKSKKSQGMNGLNRLVVTSRMG